MTWMTPDRYVCSEGVTHEDRHCPASGEGPRRFARNHDERGAFECFHCIETVDAGSDIAHFYNVPPRRFRTPRLRPRKFAAEVPTTLGAVEAGFNRHTADMAERYKAQRVDAEVSEDLSYTPTTLELAAAVAIPILVIANIALLILTATGKLS